MPSKYQSHDEESDDVSVVSQRRGMSERRTTERIHVRSTSRARSVSRARSSSRKPSKAPVDESSSSSASTASSEVEVEVEKPAKRSNQSLVRARPEPPSFKRLVVCCDGTWLDSNSGIQDGKLVPPSNVTRLSRAVRSRSAEGITQIVYYQAGIGSTGTRENKIIEGATGSGLAENVRDAYAFIANNYTIGDEIFLIGFSRGAFTARSVGGMIGHVGVLTKAGLAGFPVIYMDWAHRYQRNYRTPERNIPFPNKPSINDPQYMREMQRRGLTTLNVRIKAIAVFDTVGSLGVPRVGWLGRFGQKTPESLNEYAFYDTTLDDCVDNAFQALALDEKRAPFQPCVWEKRGNHETNLIQVWFPGVHANVGGGYNDQELANITLAWMMSMLAPLLDLNIEYIVMAEKENAAYYEDKKRTRPRPWSFGKIYNSVTGAFAAAGTKTRTPGDYHRLDPLNGDPTSTPLRDTNEYVHAAVRSRFVLEGPGYANKRIYDPPALRDWRLRSDASLEGLPTPWFWEMTGRDRIILPEAPLRPIERKLLRFSPDIDDYVNEAPPPPRRSKRP